MHSWARGLTTYSEYNVKPFLFEIVANKRNGLDVDKSLHLSLILRYSVLKKQLFRFDYIARDCHAIGQGENVSLTRQACRNLLAICHLPAVPPIGSYTPLASLRTRYATTSRMQTRSMSFVGQDSACTSVFTIIKQVRRPFLRRLWSDDVYSQGHRAHDHRCPTRR